MARQSQPRPPPTGLGAPQKLLCPRRERDEETRATHFLHTEVAGQKYAI